MKILGHNPVNDAHIIEVSGQEFDALGDLARLLTPRASDAYIDPGTGPLFDMIRKLAELLKGDLDGDCFGVAVKVSHNIEIGLAQEGGGLEPERHKGYDYATLTSNSGSSATGASGPAFCGPTEARAGTD